MPMRTKSGRLTKLGDFERQVKGKMPDREMYAIANKEGLMHGNKATGHGALPAKRNARSPGFRGRKSVSYTGP